MRYPLQPIDKRSAGHLSSFGASMAIMYSIGSPNNYSLGICGGPGNRTSHLVIEGMHY